MFDQVRGSLDLRIIGRVVARARRRPAPMVLAERT
jgi:hypothetical protein